MFENTLCMFRESGQNVLKESEMLWLQTLYAD